MSEFERIIDSKVASVSHSKATKATVGEAAADGVRALLKFSEGLPYIGPVAQLLNVAINLCDQHKCNKEAFELLKIRLCRFAQLLFGEKGLAAIARERSQNETLKTFTKRMEDTLNEAIDHLGVFAKAGFFSSILSGSKPQQQFNQLDAEMTACMNELSIALQAVQINEQAQTYQVVCDIQSKIDHNGGLQGVSQNPALLQSLADEIGADVEDLKVEVKDSLDRIEATVNQVDVNVKITMSKMDVISRDLQAFMSAMSTPNSKVTSADLASFTLTSTPEIHYSKVLGQGTFGTVYEGKYNNELVAVKVISTAAAAGLTPAQLNELSKEVLMHSKVSNLPGVVRLYGANLTAEPRCVVLELADGSLHDALHDHRPSIDLSLTSKLSLAVQVSSAMACISDMGLVHRDIKSSNVLIFLQSQGRVSAKLSDFGLAKVNTENTFADSKTAKGTPPYMAPELFKGDYSSASDVYAFAVMLNEMLLEKSPFPSQTVHEIMMTVVTNRGRPTAYTATTSDIVGCRLMSLISSCWNQDPQLRMTFQALANELSQLLAASVEIAKNGTNIPVSGIKGEPTTPLSPQSPEAAISTLAEWLTNSCSLLPYDSSSLAHTLVTTKCITSVAALSEVLHIRPDMLTQELKVADAYVIQIKKVLNHGKREVLLKDLSIEQVCLLLEHQNLHSNRSIIVENEVSGTVLATSFDSVDDLKEIGIKVVQARTLFKLIGEWKAQGLPAEFLRELKSTKSKSDTTTSSSGLSQLSDQASIDKGLAAPVPVKALPPPKPPKVLGNGEDSNSVDAGKVAGSGDKAVAAAEVAKWYYAARFGGDTSACQLLIAAAEKGNHLAEAYLGILFDKGCNGLAKNADKALFYTQRSLTWLQAEVVKGNKYALFLLGFCYNDGRAVTKDMAEAVRLYKVAADQGHTDAQRNLGFCYEYGTGVTKDEAEAIRLYKLAADQGHAGALNSLGWCYANGTGVVQDVTEAARLYKLAADQGQANAQCNLGWCYANSTGVTKDGAEAARLYKLAADQGLAAAQYGLGVCYANGTGVTKDETEAARLYKLAADQGYAAAQCNLGLCYQNGNGVIKNEAEAIRLYKLAADQGDADAQRNLGVCYTNGTGVTKDVAEAARLFKLAADQGHADAERNLGWCYANGTGVTKNVAEAARLYKLAADQGHAVAQVNLGVCYEYGTGVTKDVTEAARLYKLAADQGHAAAQFNLGVCYHNGTGVTKDVAEAARLYKLAADQGHAAAQYWLGVCYYNGTGVTKDVAEAARLYKLAADQGHAAAQYWLGVCYQEGTGVAKNKSEAKKYLKLAADQGFEGAAEKLKKYWF